MERRGSLRSDAQQSVVRAGSPQSRLPVYARLAAAAIVFSPFQYALTWRTGFPLKISEVLIVVAAVAFIMTSRRLPGRRDTGNLIVALLVAAVALSAIVNLAVPPAMANPPGFTRSVTLDLALYVGYAALVGVAWWMMRTLPGATFGRAMIVAVWVCGAATLFQSLMMTLGQPEILEALGFTSPLSGRTAGDDTLRSGPFLEGQHLGFFAGAGLLVCLHRRAWLGAAVSVGMALYSESTTSLVGLVAGAVLAIVTRPNGKALLTVAAVPVGLGVIAVVYRPFREWILFQLAKLGFSTGDDYSRYVTLSLDIRGAKTDIGWRILAEHPLLGVGSGRYGIAFHEYSDEYRLPHYYYSGTMRAIAENAYAHIGAEQGLLGLGALVALVGFLIIRNIRRVPSQPILVALAGYVAVAIATQSSWTFLPIWILFAYLAVDHDPVRGRGWLRRRSAVGR